MHQHPQHVCKGAAPETLQDLLGIAQQRKYQTLSLETDIHRCFEPAITLYKTFGFTQGAAVAGYAEAEFNQFYYLN